MRGRLVVQLSEIIPSGNNVNRASERGPVSSRLILLTTFVNCDLSTVTKMPHGCQQNSTPTAGQFVYKLHETSEI